MKKTKTASIPQDNKIAFRALKELRGICLSYPESTEGKSYGNPTFYAGKKVFAVFDCYKGEYNICLKVDAPTKAKLINNPQFFDAPYIGRYGWISLKIKPKMDWYEVKDLVLSSYKAVALKRMIKALDHQGN